MDRKEVLRRAFGFSMSEEGRDKYTDDHRDAGGPTKWGMALNYNRDIIPDKDGKDNPIWAIQLRRDTGNASGFSWTPVAPDLPEIDLSGVIRETDAEKEAGS